MSATQYSFNYTIYTSSDELNEADKTLVAKARATVHQAYAPYSKFFVAAAAQLNNGEVLTGTNQENASYPVGTCAERVLLASAATFFPNVPITTMAISYYNSHGKSSQPISPCGMCRQYLLEYEKRVQQPIRLLLTGQEGEIFVIETVEHLLPFSFSGDDLKK